MFTEEVRVGDATLTLETGRIARQAHGALVVRQGKSFLLAAVVADPEPRPGADFFPLTVEYRERMAAAGRIPGGFLRREGRMTEREVLTSRLIDRTLRPLFADGFRCETQVSVTVFSADRKTDLDVLGLIAAAGAVHLSDLPFAGPVGGVRLTRVEGRHHALRSPTKLSGADLDLVISASRQGLVMLEGGAERVSVDEFLAAVDAATTAIQPILDAFDRLRDAAGRPRRAHAAPTPDPVLAERVRDAAAAGLAAALGVPDKAARYAALNAARSDAEAALPGEDPAEVRGALDALYRRLMRRRILDHERVDGRGHDAVRPIAAEVGLLAGAHGSALFTRGETQALVTATLGAQREAQDVETPYGREQDRFMLHYNFPAWSVGEARAPRGPGRREIGHGTLARRALLPVLPPADGFPYALRVTADITESNGSSSMATVCGGSLALMDAGVPLAAPVAGIAMGLIVEGADVAILSDILGDEDHQGDMDFKVAGTADGITAVQLDNKLGSLPREMFARALLQAEAGRRHILAEMERALAAPRESVAESAPQHACLQISPTRVGALIGPGGRIIQDLQSRTRTRIEVDDTGHVLIYGQDAEGTRAAAREVQNLTLELRRGGLYRGRITSVKDFGAFVRVGDHEGLIHASELDRERVESPATIVHEGQELLVRALGADDRGRLSFSRKAALGESDLDALNA